MSNPALAIRMTPETIRRLAYGSISSSYAAIGTALANPSRILLIQNLTNATVTISFDGTNDHIDLLTDTSLLLDVSANNTIQAGSFFIGQGTIFYAKSSGSPSSGSVNVSTFYGVGAAV